MSAAEAHRTDTEDSLESFAHSEACERVLDLEAVEEPELQGLDSTPEFGAL
jgi:hypothetical protein